MRIAEYPYEVQPSPPDPQAWKREAPAPWQGHEPPFLHSLKWRDDWGIEHLTCIRASTSEELWREVKKVTALIKVAKSTNGKQNGGTHE